MKPLILGWREWASLPEFNIPFIKVKVDTGAKTSSLHAFNLSCINVQNEEYAKFSICPLQNNHLILAPFIAKIIDKRTVKSSNGQAEIRPVIRSKIRIGEYIWEIDITLTNRDIMKYRFLLGRSAMSGFNIEPDQSYLHGKISRRQLITTYQPEFNS